MAASTTPIFPLTPVTSIVAAMLTADTTVNGDLSGANVRTLYTAGANGGRVDKVKVRALGTNVATVIRLFINNGSTAATATNNALYMERTLAATTASAVAELADVEIPLDLALPAGYKILATIGTTVAAGIIPMAVAADY
jgi:hypothetical protein